MTDVSPITGPLLDYVAAELGLEDDMADPQKRKALVMGFGLACALTYQLHYTDTLQNIVANVIPAATAAAEAVIPGR